MPSAWAPAPRRAWACLVCFLAACSAPASSPGSDANPPADAPPVPDGRPDAQTSVTLTIRKAPGTDGQGSVTAGTDGPACDASCSSTSGPVPYLRGATLEAKPASGSFFLGWEGACTGVHRFCHISTMADITVTARFAKIRHNLVFTTSKQFPGTSTMQTADTECRASAMRAGLTGNFVAFFFSDPGMAFARLQGARGFVNMDGQPFGDTVDDLAAGR